MYSGTCHSIIIAARFSTDEVVYSMPTIVPQNDTDIECIRPKHGVFRHTWCSVRLPL